MTIVKTHAKINRKIRHLNKIIKINNSIAKAKQDEAIYYQEVQNQLLDKIASIPLASEIDLKDYSRIYLCLWL